MVQVPMGKKVWIEYRIDRLHKPSQENWSLFATIRVPGYTWMIDSESFRNEKDAVARLEEIAEIYGIPPDSRTRKPPLLVGYWW